MVEYGEIKVYKFMFPKGPWYYIMRKTDNLTEYLGIDGIGGLTAPGKITIIKGKIPEYVFGMADETSWLDLLVTTGLSKEIVERALEAEDGSRIEYSGKELLIVDEKWYSDE